MIKNNWTLEEVTDMYSKPLFDLIYSASDIHRKYQNPGEIQVCTLLSIKTGGCTEDCSYCSQSIKNQTNVKVQPLLKKEDVLNAAKAAKLNGSTRFCMGAAWRRVRDNRDFEKVLEMVREVSKLDMEVCCTLGMLSDTQAEKLKQAGLHAYNHNLDTSADYYNNVISTRNIEDRLNTLDAVRKAGISVCCGGIIGLGETHQDRISMLHMLSTMQTHPDSVPINALVRVEGTPLQNNEKVVIWDMIRMIATSRVLMPKTTIRLSAGRSEMSDSEQALCFMSGANSIFSGDKLLTTPNTDLKEDMSLFDTLGLRPKTLLKNKFEEIPRSAV